MSTEPSAVRPQSPVDRLLIAAVPHRLHIGLTLVARARLTPAEALSLRWGDVDSVDRRLRLPGREVRITAVFGELLHWHACRQRVDARNGGFAWDPHGYVVADAMGRPYTPEHADSITADLAEQVGLPPIPMEALRHPALR